ncbi:DRTGG domain-containing protein [Chloroflexota bacterium]
MAALYLTSLERGSGKTTICAGLGKHLLNDGKKVGFFKPVIADGKNPPAEDTDSDTLFIKRLLALDESPEVLCPVFNNGSDLTNRIREAYTRLSQGKDVVIIEGISEQHQTSPDIVAALDAKVIIVEGYSKELLKETRSYQDFGEHLLGIVLNKVPRRRLEQVRGETSTAGINILGVLPEDRVLFAMTMGELAEHIQGEILTGAEQSAELVENIMLGAKGVDSGLDYFGRKTNKAAVIESERPDMQLAALQTSTRCLVLTGDTALKPVVLHQAEEKNVPIILARDDIPTIITNIEAALSNSRFNQENKLSRLSEIMGQQFDFQAVYKGLVIAS